MVKTCHDRSKEVKEGRKGRKEKGPPPLGGNLLLTIERHPNQVKSP